MKRKLIEILKAQAKRLQEAGVALGQGCSTYWDEAAWLALRALNRPIDESLDAIDVDDADVSTVEAVFEKRIQRTPAAYVLGEAWLQGERFFVDRRVVIPRSLISEVLVEYTESGLFKTERISTALDMCTGCGALAILMTKYFARLQRVDASDISADALDVARINVQQHRLTDRVRLVQSDLFAAVQRQYDLIVCNPPYVNDKSMQKLPEEYKKEPSIALAGGVDGMHFVRRILSSAPKYLANDDSQLVLEIGNEHRNFERAFPRAPVTWLVTSAGERSVFLIDRLRLRAMQHHDPS